MWRLLRNKCLIRLGMLALFLVGLGWGWKPALIWYCVHRLSRCEEKEQDKWLRRLEWLGESALPALQELLHDPDPQVCQRATTALLRLARTGNPTDARCQELASYLCSHFESFSPPGREAALAWFLALPEAGFSSKVLADAAVRIVRQAAACEEPGLCAPALELADRLLRQHQLDMGQDQMRRLLCRGLHATQTAARLRAVQLLLQPHFNHDPVLLSQATPLLHDADPAVRRATLLLVGAQPEVVAEEQLLPLLHDPQAELRRLCETALRSRGLAEEQIELARLISDPRPTARLQVLFHLRTAHVDPTVWLQRLSQDSAPAVRAAAIRAASLADIDLGPRLRQMSTHDPSPTVQQLAGYYLQRNRSIASR